MVVALDVRNAFNTASWQTITNTLREKGGSSGLLRILQSYFMDRELIYNTSEGPVVSCVSAGVPQGSILGPTLWNVMYDGVLRIPLSDEAKVIGYADDLVVLAPGRTPEESAAVAEAAVLAVDQ